LYKLIDLKARCDVLLEAANAPPANFEVVGRLQTYIELLEGRITRAEDELKMLSDMHKSINEALAQLMYLEN